MRLTALLSAVLLVLSSPAARADYLSAQDAFAAAWAALLPRIPADAELAQIVILPNEIDVVLRLGGGGGALGRITAQPAQTKDGTGHRITGPVPAPGIADGVFRLDEVARLDGLPALMARARAVLKLGPDADITRIEVSHPADGAVTGPGLIFDLATPLYLGSVTLSPAGRVRALELAPDGQPESAARQPTPAPTPTPTPTPAPTPAAEAQPFRGDSGRDLVAGLATFAAHLGPDTLIYEVDARPDRITIDRPHPTQGGTVAILTLTAQGFREERTFPTMMQTQADLFPLSALATLTPEAVEAARAAGLAAVGLPGGQLERLRLWSGSPFWRHPAGEPFFDIRVGVPPNGQPNGYGVVTLGGQVVESFR